VASDAGAMASQITGTTQSVSLLGTEFSKTGVEASNLGVNAQAGASGLTTLGTEAVGTSIKLSTLSRGIMTISSLGSACTTLASDLGLVDKQTAKWMSTVLAIVTVVSGFVRLQSYSTILTTGHTASITLNTTAQTAQNIVAGAGAGIQAALATATSGATTAEVAQTAAQSTGILTQAAQNISFAASAVAHYIYAAACWVATTAENALNISQATFLALTGVGIAVIIAAAAAMWYFANSMNAATASVKTFNSTAAQTSNATKSITRAGESVGTSVKSGSGEQALYRRGIE
jgi:hypothetical protein